MTKTHSIFPTIFFQTEVDSNNLLKETLCDQMLEASKYMKAPDLWFTNNLKTSFVEEPSGFNIIEDNFPLLEKSYLETIGKVIKRPHEIDLTDEDIWYNVYLDGEFQDQHVHVSNSHLRQHHFSCIHFCLVLCYYPSILYSLVPCYLSCIISFLVPSYFSCILFYLSDILSIILILDIVLFFVCKGAFTPYYYETECFG